MRTRGGQVVIYLALVITVIAILIAMNVGSFLGVTARNTTMNGGDAAALAVARHQGELMNRIGALNIEHLEAALNGDTNRCAAIVREQRFISFLGPLDGIRIGNEWAKKNDCDRNDRMLEILKDHVAQIREVYAVNPDIYPPPWIDEGAREGARSSAWDIYAQQLELALSDGIYAGPDNIEFMDAATGHLLLNQGFYHAIAGRDWCWFLYNARAALDDRSPVRDWYPLPTADEDTRRRRSVNSEVYSLHLAIRTGSAVRLLGAKLIAKLTGATEKEVREAGLLHDELQNWFFFDTSGYWRTWWEIDPAEGFPAMGRVKKEYDVRGAAAVCRTSRKFMNVVHEVVREAVWSAAAKPFGAIENDDGELDTVISLGGFVPKRAFAEAKLVPLDTVGGVDLSTADPDWMWHVRKHLMADDGLYLAAECWYCEQLRRFDNFGFRAAGSNWLKIHSSDCVRPRGYGSGHGGSAHGH